MFKYKSTICFLFYLLLICNSSFAADGIIFGNSVGHKIEAAFLDGSNRHDFITNTPGVLAIAVDKINGKIFWSENSGTTRRIRRSDLNGGNIVTVKPDIQSNEFVYGIALDTTNQRIYWTEYHADVVRVADYDGSDESALITAGIEGPVGIDIDSDDGKIYIAEADSNEISSADMNGLNLTVLISGTPTGPLHLVLDKTSSPKQLYYALFTSLNRVDIDGSNDTAILNTGIGMASALTIDFTDRRAYIGDIGNYQIHSVDLDGSNFTANISSTMSVFGIAFADVAANTPTPTATAVNTQTATPVTTTTPVAAATTAPTLTPTPPASVGQGNITGILMDSDGNPVSNALVSLLTNSNLSARVKSNSSAVLRTTLTDLFGTYRFSNLPSGEFLIQPKLDGVSFNPASFTASSGFQAPTGLAQKTRTLDERCSSKNVVSNLVSFGDSTHKLLDHTKLQIERLTRALQKSGSGAAKDKLLSKLASIAADCDSAYSSALNESGSLPSIIVSCPKEVGCSAENYRSSLNSIRKDLTKILRQTKRLAAIGEETSDEGNKLSYLYLQNANRRYAAAVQKFNQLSSSNQVCGDLP